MVNKKAIKLINNEEYEKANQLSFILFQKKKTDLNWALPGGAIATLERGKDVVKREFQEETGCDVEVIRPLW